MSTEPPLRIGLGGTRLLKGLQSNSVDGLGVYTRALWRALQANPQNETQLLAFSGSCEAEAIAGVRFQGAGSHKSQSLRAMILGSAFPQLSSAALDVQIFHATDHLVPKLSNVPVVATLMDAIPLAHPEWVDYPMKRLTNALWRRSFQWADRIIAPSEFSKQEIVRWFGICDQRISVIPLGVDPAWSEQPDAESVENVRKLLNGDRQFLLSIGTLQPRKNYETLLRAHERLPQTVRRELPLVIAGSPGWKSGQLIQRMTDQKHVIWIQSPSDADLKALMHGALALITPSLYEGFGLPALEAFQSGTPVIAAAAGATAEICEDAALLFEPTNECQLAELINEVQTNDHLAIDLKKRGTEKARSFSWENTAAETRLLYQSLL